MIKSHARFDDFALDVLMEEPALYFSDMSPYTYAGGKTGWLQQVWRPRVVNVGWLDGDHSFPRGIVAGHVMDRLFHLCKTAREFAMKGHHHCAFCDHKCAGECCGVWEERHGVTALLGSSEIRVITPKVTFAAPDLIYHYIRAHQYLPPAEFLNTVGRLEIGELGPRAALAAC